MNEDKGFKVIDRRGKEEPKEVCRVCGAPECHSKQYGQPTMDCIKYLRTQNGMLENRDADRRMEIEDLKARLRTAERVAK